MPLVRVACHTYVFSEYGYDQADSLTGILTIVANAGFNAVELNATALDREDALRAMTGAASRTGLTIIGASNGGPLWDAAEWDSLKTKMQNFTEKLRHLPYPKLGFSPTGKRLAERSEAENQQFARGWNELAEMCMHKGITLAYHNHGEPLEDVEYVIENVPADVLALGPDLDWLRFGGIEPLSFLRDHMDRVVMMHLRDYVDGGDRTWALGEGDADYVALGKLLDEKEFIGDTVIELAIPPGANPADRPLADLLRQSRDYLRDTMGV